jgi:uroporphyrinogen-III synthase
MLAVAMTSDLTLLMTRPMAASEAFVEMLQQAGVDLKVVMSPVLEIVSRDVTLPSDLAGVVFTSKNGVAAVAGQDLPCWCVGDSTAAAAKEAGWQAVSAGGDAEALYQRILADAPRGPLLHVRGEHARGNLAERLSAVGIETRDVVAYAQEARALTDEAKRLLMRENPVVLPLFSPRSAQHVVSQGPYTAPLQVVAISDAVAEEAAGLRAQGMEIARTPDAVSMVAAIKHFADAACRIESGTGRA